MVSVSHWRKSVALLTLVFFANTGFAAVCDFGCSILEVRPIHQAGVSDANTQSAGHHSGHHSPVLSPRSSTAIESASEGSSHCEHSVRVTSQFKLGTKKSATNLGTVRPTFDPVVVDAAISEIQPAESPPFLSNVPIQFSLRI